MADSENVGAIDVSIGADYGPLKADFASAQTDSQAAGSAIADAFNSTAATGVDALTEAIGTLTGTLTGLSSQVGDLSGSLDQYTTSAEHAGEASEQAETGLAAMAEQMAAVGEALVITEGMRELGTEALGAADAITHASIALTTITGSGDQAKETIEGLETIGQSDGLAMPSLLSAATRMQAILGPATDVNEQLRLVADGAAVMGTDIETATTKFDQMATAGTASARTLTSLGISLSSLATAFNSVIEGSDETASSVAASFKALDQSQRIEVLDAALKTLGGTAEQVANQTFGGQWQQLANSWEGIMVQAGQALLPVISGITDLTKTDIIPFLQDLVDDWKNLSPPMQEAAVAVALSVAAVVPLTGALAATGLAVSGLSALLPALDGLLATLGITAATTATEEGAATAATVALGEASETASVEVAAAGVAAAGAGAIVGGVLAAALVAGAVLWADWKTRVDAAQSSVQGIIPQFDAWLNQQVKAASSNQALEAAQDKVNEAFANGLISAKEYAAMIAQIDTASKALLGTYVSTLPQITLLSDAALKATSTHALLSQALADAQANLGKVEVAYQANKDSAQQLLAAQTAVTNAQTALNASMGPTPGSLDAINAAAQKLANTNANLVNSQQLATNDQAALTSSLDLANTAYATSVDKVGLLVSALNSARAAYDGSTTSRQRVVDLENELQAAYAGSLKASDNLDTTLKNYASTMGDQVTTAQRSALTGLEDLSSAIGPVMSKFTGLDQEIITLSDGFKNAGVEAVNISSGPLVGLQSALDEAKAKVATLSAEIQNGVNVGQQYEKALTAQMNAQIALDQETAALGTGVSTNTDKVSLLTVAVADARAKVDDLTTAVQNGLPVQGQLLSAETALNDAVTASHPPLTTATTDTGNLKDVAQQAIPVMGELADKMGTVGAQATAMATSVASAINSVNTAINSVAGNPAGFSGSGRVTETGFGSFGQPIYSVTASTPPETVFKQAMQAALADADQASNPKGSSDPLTVAQEALAEATATLKVDQSYFGQTSSTGGQLVSVSALQSAQAAVTTAQAAINKLTGGSTGAAVLAPGGGVVGTVVNGSVVPAGTGAASTGSSTATDTSAYGGSYPGVVTHQASGEVWVVDTSGVASSGGGGAVSAGNGNDAASALAATSTAATVGAAADTMATVVQQLGLLSQSVSQLGAGQYGALDNAPVTTGGTLGSGSVTSSTGYFNVNGIVLYLVNGQLANGDYNGLSFVNGVATGIAAGASGGGTPAGNYAGTLPATGGTYNTGSNPAGDTAANTVAAYQAAVAAAAAAGVPYDGSVPWDGKNPSASTPHAQVPASAGTASAGGGGLSTLSVSIDMRGAMVGNQAQMLQQVTAAVQKGLTQNLFAAGARLTQA